MCISLCSSPEEIIDSTQFFSLQVEGSFASRLATHYLTHAVKKKADEEEGLGGGAGQAATEALSVRQDKS